MARTAVLTPNPAVDVTYRVPQQALGETVRVQQVERRAGGKGLNVLRVLRTLGHDAVALQPLGGGTGRWLHDRLVEERLPEVSVWVPEPTRTTVAVTDETSHPTLYAEPGSPLPPTAWRALATAVGEAAEPGGTVVVAGSLPPGSRQEDVDRLVRAAHRAGARVLVDTSGPALSWAARAGADLLKPNAAEALAATGAADLDDAVASLLAHGAGAVVVSRGAEGLLAVDAGGQRYEQQGVPDVHGNPTGAGDAATAGLVAALELGAPLPEALRWAAVLGAAAVLRPTAGEVRLPDLEVLAGRLPAGPPPRLPFPSAADLEPS